MRFSALRKLFGRPATPAATLEKLLKQCIVFLGSVINDATSDDIIAKLLFLERQSANETINLVINSPGGVVAAGLAIMDTMDQLRAPVATHCLRLAHSMAAVILANGRNGSRTAEAHSAIAFTLPCAPDGADEQKLKEAARFGEILISKMSTATKRPDHEIRELFEQSTLLSAPEAIAAGVIDRIRGA